MSVNLSSGQKVNLSKQRSGLSKVMVDIGWDEFQQNSGFSGMFKAKPQDIDCDAFAILLGYDGHLINHSTRLTDCTAFFNSFRWTNGSIKHMGDNLVSTDEGDDKQIFVILNNVSYDVGSIVFAVNIYEAFKRNLYSGMICNAFIHAVGYDRQVELCRFNLIEDYLNQIALIVGGLIRTRGKWKFRTDSTTAKVENIVDVVSAFA